MNVDRSSKPMIWYCVSPVVSNEVLNDLFDAAWPNHAWSNFQPILARSLAFVCAYQAERLVGFVNLVWDGGIHAWILDTTVHPDVQRRGIGHCLVAEAVSVARQRGVGWLHVDFEPHLRGFYEQCGFWHTDAGLMRLDPPKA